MILLRRVTVFSMVIIVALRCRFVFGQSMKGDERCSDYLDDAQQFRACLVEPCKLRSEAVFPTNNLPAKLTTTTSPQHQRIGVFEKWFRPAQGGVLFNPNNRPAAITTTNPPNSLADALPPAPPQQQPLECYERMQPPTNRLADGLQEVYVALGATHLSDVDESHQKLRMPSWIMLAWRDERLAFNASGRQPLTFRNDEVWTPRLTIDEAREVSVQEDGFSTTTFTNVISYGSFNVQLKTIADDVTCYFDGISFPYAQQNCTLSLMAWAPVKLIALPLVDCGQTLLRRTAFSQRELDDVDALQRIASSLCLYGAPTASNHISSFLDPKRDNVKNRWRSGHWKLATKLVDGQCSDSKNFSSTDNIAVAAEGCYTAPIMYIEEHGGKDSYFSVVRFMFSMKRDATMDVLIWLVTPGILSFFFVIVVYSVCDPSERFGFGASVLITDVLMLIAVSEKVPNAVRVRFNTEFNMPMIMVYYFTLCLAVVLACYLSSVPEAISKAFQDKGGWARHILMSTRVLNVIFCTICLLAMSLAVILISSQWTI